MGLIKLGQILPALPDLIDQWRTQLDRHVAAGELSGATVLSYVTGMRRFERWLGNQRFDTVDSNAILDWLAFCLEESKPNAVHVWLASVRAFWRWAYGVGLVSADPTVGIKGPKRKNTKKRHLRDRLTDDEMRAVLLAPRRNLLKGQRDAAILYLMAYTGVRTVELFRANLDDVRTKENRLVLEVRGKGAEADPDYVVIPGGVGAILREWIAARSAWLLKHGKQSSALFISLSQRNPGERLSLKSYREMVKGYLRTVGIDSRKKTAHSFRHTALSKLVEAVGPARAMEVSRHTKVDTLMIYYQDGRRLKDPPEEYIDYEE